MPGFLLHFQGVASCIHGGKAIAPPGNPRVKVSTLPVLTVLDQVTVAGCLFQIPVPGGTKPQPCVTIKFEPTKRVLIMGQPALLASAVATGVSAEGAPQGQPTFTVLMRVKAM
jgi:hypothetical protein